MPIDGYLRFVLALVFVLALIVGVAWVFRRYGRGRVVAPRRTGGYRRRLGIVEAVALDSRRKLVLVRRDDREHLLIIGVQSETVVESGIVPDDANDRADGWDATERSTDSGSGSPDARPQPRGASFLRLVRQSTREP